MFNANDLRRQLLRIDLQRPRNLLFDGAEFPLRRQSPQRHLWDLQSVENLFIEPRSRVSRYGDVSKLFGFYPGRAETILDRLKRESGAVLDTIEPFLFHGRH